MPTPGDVSGVTDRTEPRVQRSTPVEPVASGHAPSQHDTLVRRLSDVAGGPAGRRRAYPQPSGGAFWMWGPGAVLSFVACGAIAVALILSQPCRGRGWPSPNQFTHLCYSDLPSAIGGAHGPQSAGVWAIVRLADWLAPAGLSHLRAAVDLVTILSAISLCVLVAAVIRLAGHRPWDAALVAASPVLLTAGLVSLDLLPIAATYAGLALFAGSWRADHASGTVDWPRAVGAGFLIGLATAVRPAAAIALLAIALLAARTGRWSGAGATMLAALLGWALPNVAQFLASPTGWWAYPKSLLHPTLGYGSIMVLPRLLAQGIPVEQRDFTPPTWLAFTGVVVLGVLAVLRTALPADKRREWLPLDDIGMQVSAVFIAVAPPLIVLGGPWALRAFTTAPPGDRAGQLVGVLGALLVTTGVGWFALVSRRRARLPAIMLLLTVGLLLVAPSVPVQAGLWLVPLIALTVPSWRVALAWAGVECLYTAGIWLYLYGLSQANRGLPVGWFTLLVVVRFAAWITVAAMAARLIRHPELDPVRARRDPGRAKSLAVGASRYRDDPAGGPFDEAEDASGVSKDFTEDLTNR